MYECTNHLNNYYTTNYNEHGRLTSRHGLVEYLTTMRYVEQYLTPEAYVLEIGAGTGRYSRTIADMGHKVEAVELVPTNIEIFRENLQPTHDINITQGNALDLSMFADNTFDMTLLLGPLYHLYTDKEKHQAIQEALRVTKPGGVIFTAYCLVDASITLSGFANNSFDIKQYVQRGKINPTNFATTSEPEDIFELVRKEDIDRMMANFAVERLHYIATDLFTIWIRDAISQMDDETFALYLRYHFSVCEREDLAGAGHHSLDIFRKREIE
ncbi:MAG: class I SAM-dependent methyltransferase [Defluviitaleaceae bacterium]|nr:class I SAM-dependent methyltransferase [Defluviitaleaceae bacterium]